MVVGEVGEAEWRRLNLETQRPGSRGQTPAKHEVGRSDQRH